MIETGNKKKLYDKSIYQSQSKASTIQSLEGGLTSDFVIVQYI
jgi:hypothetical protein